MKDGRTLDANVADDALAFCWTILRDLVRQLEAGTADTADTIDTRMQTSDAMDTSDTGSIPARIRTTGRDPFD